MLGCLNLLSWAASAFLFRLPPSAFMLQAQLSKECLRQSSYLVINPLVSLAEQIQSNV